MQECIAMAMAVVVVGTATIRMSTLDLVVISRQREEIGRRREGRYLLLQQHRTTIRTAACDL